jgi:hypothetical protein
MLSPQPDPIPGIGRAGAVGTGRSVPHHEDLRSPGFELEAGLPFGAPPVLDFPHERTGSLSGHATTAELALDRVAGLQVSLARASRSAMQRGRWGVFETSVPPGNHATWTRTDPVGRVSGGTPLEPERLRRRR